MLRLALLFLSSAVLAPPPDTAGTRNATASPQQAYVPPKYAPPSSFLPGVPTPNAAAFAARQQQPSYAPGGASPAPATPMDQQQPSYAPGVTSPAPATPMDQQQPSYAPGGASPAPATPMDQQQPSYAPGGASPAPGPVSPSNPSYGAPAGGTGNTAYNVQDQDKTVSFDFYKEDPKDNCVPVEKLVYVDECQPYVEKVCFTQQQENCQPIMENNCTGTVDHFEDRMCFNVTELQCELQEVVTYDMVDETYNVQKCTQVSDRVCDTVYDLAKTSKDDFQCVDLKNNNCWDEEKMIQDLVCKYSYSIDCGKHKPQDGKGSVGCTKTPTKQCYDIPRKVKMQMCKVQASKFCDKLTNDFPYPVEKQACHSDPIKKCELESRSRPKKAKKYTYTKRCKPVVREVCDTADRQSLRAVCSPSQRITCTYSPKEKCTEENKQYCYKAEKTIVDKVCTPPKKQSVDTVTSYV